jgi:hypothetical protein
MKQSVRMPQGPLPACPAGTWNELVSRHSMNLEREFEPYAFCVNSGHQEADLARDDVAATATARAPLEHRTAASSALTFHWPRDGCRAWRSPNAGPRHCSRRHSPRLDADERVWPDHALWRVSGFTVSSSPRVGMAADLRILNCRPREIRPLSVCLVSAMHLLDHFPRSPAESRCVQILRCHPPAGLITVAPTAAAHGRSDWAAGQGA